MKAMHEHIKKRVPGLDMIAQVHDELVFECDDDKVDEACAKIKEVFELNWLPGSDTLPDIPVTGDAMYGQTWMEAK
jgi:DNA polymerase I-like protein with 3'-5' exonuclease and polymerase domains